MKITEFDIVLISYDEPNADINYADLCNKAPWAKRVHGVKGSDHAHKAAAELAETDWFVTVDADNVIDSKFLDLDITIDTQYSAYSWSSLNIINGLRYGNGGLKLWSKDHVYNMKSHESAFDKKSQVDFCWDEKYKTYHEVYSNTVINCTPFQAWRAGFREGVKMTLLDGVKVPPQEIKERIWWHNIHRLRVWSTVGMHEENGKYAILGARMGTWMANCTDWNYVDVRDFEILRSIYNHNIDHDTVEEDIKEFGERIKLKLGLDWPYFDSLQSKFTLDLYNETFRLAKTCR